MAKTTTASRRQRRAQFRAMGYLHIKNMFGRFSEQGLAWYKKTGDDGRVSHENTERAVLERTEDFLQTKANIMKETWASIGYNTEEIAMLEEAFFTLAVKNQETIRENKKEARKLHNDARKSLNSRLNADS